MDIKNSNIKWIVSAVTFVATFIGVYYLYKKLSNPNNESSGNFIEDEESEEEPEIRRPNQTLRDEAIQFKRRGNEYFNVEDYENAIKEYENAIRICPPQFSQDRAIFYQNKAISLYKLRLFDKALIEANIALEYSPQYNTALVTRSKIFESQGKYQEALLDITAAVTFDSSDKSDSINLMDKIVKILAIEIVKNELKNKPILQSESDIKIYLESFSNDPFVTVVNSDMVDSGNQQNGSISQCFHLFNTGSYTDSFQAVIEALKSSGELNNATLGPLYLLRGTFYMLSCREDLALNDFDQVIKNSESKPLEKINAIIKCATKVMTDDVSEMEKMFSEAIYINPDCADIYYHRGLCYENLEESQKAIIDYQKVLKIDPKHTLATVHIIFNKYFVNNDADGVNDCFNEFNKLIQKFPDCIQIKVLFVKVLIDGGYYEEAEKISENMLLLQPDSGLVMSLAADVKRYLKKITRAIEILNEAILKDPKHAESYYLLATIYITEGELEKAVELLEKAIKFAKDRRLMQMYIEIREGISAQLNVSKQFDIPIKDVMHHMSQGKIL